MTMVIAYDSLGRAYRYDPFCRKHGAPVAKVRWGGPGNRLHCPRCHCQRMVRVGRAERRVDMRSRRTSCVRIVERLVAAGWSRARVAREAGVAERTLHRLMREGAVPKEGTVGRLWALAARELVTC